MNEALSMTNTSGLGSAQADQLLEKAMKLQPVLKERAKACAENCRVPDETIADFQAAGFFKILQAKAYGGYEMEPQVFYSVIIEIAKACMSSAWVLSVIGVHNWQLNLFDAEASVDVWKDDPTVLISSSYAPVGKVTPVDGGYRLSGRWSFSSGCEHCQWVFLGAVVPTQEEPWNMLNYRTFLLPRSDYQIIKNWDVIGLRGTGSHDILVDDVFVPEHHTHFMFGDVRSGKHSSKPASYQLPFMQVFSRAVCIGTLGALESALDEYVALSQRRLAGAILMKDSVSAKQIAANVKSEIESMRLTMISNFDRLLLAIRTGKDIELAERARFRYESSIVADRCIELSSRMLKAAGSSGIRRGSPILEKHLDMLASQAHIANVSEPFEINFGGILLGHDSTDPGL